MKYFVNDSSLHNIAFYKRMMCDIRESILTNTFEETKNLYLYENENSKKPKISW